MRPTGRRTVVQVMRLAAVAAIVASLLVVPGPAAVATAADWLDPTFGSGGATVLPGEGLASTMSEPDALGRIYVATATVAPVDIYTWRLRRLLADGSVDPNFSPAVLASTDRLASVIVDPHADGTVTVAANAMGGVSFYRFTGTGAPDTSHGTNGVLTVPLDDFSGLVDLQARPGGGYLALAHGSAHSPSEWRNYLIAVTAAGALDPTWAPTAPVPGVLRYLTRPTFTEAYALAARPGGGYVVSMYSPHDVGDVLDDEHVLLGFSEAGMLDPTWAATGATPGALGIGFRAHALTVDGQSVLASGIRMVSGSQWETKVLRLSGAGVPDPTFGTAGLLHLPDTLRYPSDLMVTDAGYFMGGKSPVDEGLEAPVVVKILPSGALDPTFGTGGFAFGPRGGGCVASVTRIFERPDGLLAYGADTCNPVPVVARFSPTGALDASLGDAGLVTIDRVAGHRVVADAVFRPDVVMQADGRLVGVALGVADGPAPPAAFVFRLATAGRAPMPGSFVSLPPSRILDTRNGTGAPAGVVPGGGSVVLPVTGVGGVPATGVGAVVLNVTVTQPDWDGSVVVYPTGEPKPLASNLNFPTGLTIPNLVTVKVGSGGTVTLANNQIPGKSLHLVADVAGYYRSGTATAAGTYTPLVPSRLLDTRNGTGVSATGPVPAGGSVELQITGRGGVPVSGVGAVVLNVTVTQPNWNGSVVVYPSGEPKPLASNLNFNTSQTISNLVTVKVGAGGRVMVANNQIPGKSLHLVADVAGYYLAGTATALGTFVPLTPYRVHDTRTLIGGTNFPVQAGTDIRLSFGPAYLEGNPDTTGSVAHRWIGAVLMNVTVTQGTWDGTIVVYPSATTPPLASNLNYYRNQTVPNLVIAKTSADQYESIQVRNNAITGSVHVVVDIFGYFNS